MQLIGWSFCYISSHALLQIYAAFLLHFSTNFVTNLWRYYISRQGPRQTFLFLDPRSTLWCWSKAKSRPGIEVVHFYAAYYISSFYCISMPYISTCKQGHLLSERFGVVLTLLIVRLLSSFQILFAYITMGAESVRKSLSLEWHYVTDDIPETRGTSLPCTPVCNSYVYLEISILHQS